MAQLKMKFWPFSHRHKEKKPQMTTDEIDLAIETEQRRAAELVAELNETIHQQIILWDSRHVKGGGTI